VFGLCVLGCSSTIGNLELLDVYFGELDNYPMPDACFRINSSEVVYERFDDELVAINLSAGTYHSMIGAAIDAFVLLSEEATIAELAGALGTKYAAEPAEIEMALAPFLERLQEEQLIVPATARKPRGALGLAANGNRLPFIPPSLQAHRDLANVLLLDPIHEVGDEGWPGAPDALAS